MKDAVTICKGDLKRLEEPEYWNDSLIDLRVKFYLEKMDPEKRAKVHAFSTLFYPKLTEEKDLVNAHKLVARWTKNFDIFSKDFVLVPVNQSIHWSLFVLVRPNAIGVRL